MFQRVFGVTIRKGDIAKFQNRERGGGIYVESIPFGSSFHVLRVFCTSRFRPVPDSLFRCRVQQGKDTLQCGHGSLHDGKFGGKIPDGREKFFTVLDEGYQHPKRHCTPHNFATAMPDDQGHGY